jgi:hypothetical protein
MSPGSSRLRRNRNRKASKSPTSRDGISRALIERSDEIKCQRRPTGPSFRLSSKPSLPSAVSGGSGVGGFLGVGEKEVMSRSPLLRSRAERAGVLPTYLSSSAFRP